MSKYESFCSADTIELLEKLGFDDFHPVPDMEDANYAPSLSEVQRWLREVKGLSIIVGSSPDYFHYTIYQYKKGVDHVFIINVPNYDTYELALSDGIKRCLRMLLDSKD